MLVQHVLSPARDLRGEGRGLFEWQLLHQDAENTRTFLIHLVLARGSALHHDDELATLTIRVLTYPALQPDQGIAMNGLKGLAQLARQHGEALSTEYLRHVGQALEDAMRRLEEDQGTRIRGQPLEAGATGSAFSG